MIKKNNINREEYKPCPNCTIRPLHLKIVCKICNDTQKINIKTGKPPTQW